MIKFVVKINDDYCINGLEDYGFKYDEEKKIYKLAGIIVDSQTREVYCSGKCSSNELSTLLYLFERNIITYKACSNSK